MKDLIIAKSTALALIWLMAILFGFLPCFFERMLKNNGNREEIARKITSSLHFVAAGVFLGTNFLHLIPDVAQQFVETLPKWQEWDFPLPYFVISVGLLAFLLFEHFILYWLHRRRNEDYIDMAELSCEKDDEEMHFVHYFQDIGIYDTTGGTADELNKQGQTATAVSHSCDRGQLETDVLIKNEVEKQSSLALGIENNPQANLSAQLYKAERTTSVIRSYTIALALSLHSLFEGMVLGFQTSTTKTWEMFGALSFHKALVAFSLGSRLSDERSKVNQAHIIGLLLVFSTMPILGGIVATVVDGNTTSNTSLLARAILDGLATGSFMYVTFFDMLKFDAAHRFNLWYALMVVVGFSCVAVENIVFSMNGHGTTTPSNVSMLISNSTTAAP